MLQRFLIIPAVLLIVHGGFTAAQEKFELAVPGTTEQSSAEMTASTLSITYKGKVTVYSRDKRYDVPGYVAFKNTTLVPGRIIRWPTSGTGSMQIASLTRLGKPQFGPSKMQITRVGPPPGLVPRVPPPGLVPRIPPAGIMPRVPTAGIFGTWQEANVITGRPVGITVEIRNDLTFLQSERGKASRTGTVQLVGDQLSINHLGAGREQYRVKMTADRIDFQEMRGTPAGFCWVRVPTVGIVGTWQEANVITGRPSGITVEIRNNLTFRQTERGKADRTGTVQLVGDQLSINHTGAGREQYRVNMTADRIDFQEMRGTPAGFCWLRTAAASLPPAPGLERRISQEVMPNPKLEPVTVELTNSHSEELWVLVSDLRDATKAKRLKIPAGKSESIKLDRDAGARIVETWEVPRPGGGTVRESREIEAPPQPLYDMSVYELFAQRVVIDRTGKGPKAPSVTRVPKSLGFYKIPPGNAFKGGKLDIYDVAKRQKNPGGVRLIDLDDWGAGEPKDDPIKRLLGR